MRKLFIFLVLVTSVMALAACATPAPPTPTPTPNPTPTEEPPAAGNDVTAVSGVFVRDTGEFVSFLRFYEDGTVLSVNVDTDDPAGAWPDISQLLVPENAGDYQSGTYALVNGSLSFSLTSPQGTVDYDGTFDGMRMVFDTFSHINGNEGTGREFIRLEVD